MTKKNDSMNDKKDFDINKETEKKTEESEENITFSTFIFSLSSSAFLHFGEMPNPQTGKKEVNLPAAKQTIDMLSMLQEKTKGNLTSEEKTLIDRILYELRLKYVNYSREQ